MKPAGYWEQKEGQTVQCMLCPNMCGLAAGQTGSCGVRTNRSGVLYAESYGLISSSHVDPIEKKPLYHFCPGTDIFSIGGCGCNLHCSFCQNWSISQEFMRSSDAFTPEQIVSAAQRTGTGAIAYTYNEPLIGLEFVLECAMLARERGLRNVAVTNGYVRGRAAEDAVASIDAFNVDIKSMDDKFYSKNCSGHIKPVLEFCQMVREAAKHLEITNLVIPGENDDDDALRRLSVWIAEHLGPETPLHLSAYRPQFKMKNPATELGILLHAYEIAKDSLEYVYLGNVACETGQDTLCPKCGELIVKRRGYSTSVIGVEKGCCSSCGHALRCFAWPAC